MSCRGFLGAVAVVAVVSGAVPCAWSAQPYTRMPAQEKAAVPKQAVQQEATRQDIAQRMRALGFRVTEVKHVDGDRWQVTVVGWDPNNAQSMQRDALKWDPTLKGRAGNGSTVGWDPTQKGKAGNNSTVGWDPTQTNPATIDVTASGGNLALSRGSLSALGIVQGNAQLPQGVQLH